MRKDKSDGQTGVPEAGEGKRGEEGYLGYLLRQAANASHNRVAHVLADLDMTPPQFSVLTMIAAYPGISNADIARLTLLTPQTVSVIIANLEKGGSISRRPHAVHGRIKQLDLTEHGQKLLGEARERVHRVEQELLGCVPEMDVPAVRRWLAAVAKTMANS